MVRRGAPDLGAKIADGTPTSRIWKDIWPPDAVRIYKEAMLHKPKKGPIMMRECVGDFRDWSASNIHSAFGY